MKPTEPGLWWAACLGDYSCVWGAGSWQGPPSFLPAALPRHPLTPKGRHSKVRPWWAQGLI